MAESKNGATDKTADENEALRSELEALREQVASSQRDAERLRAEANVQGVKVSREVPAKLCEVMPGNTIVTPDGVAHEGGDEVLIPWGPAADELQALGHIRIVNHDASDHPDHDDTRDRWEVRANA